MKQFYASIISFPFLIGVLLCQSPESIQAESVLLSATQDAYVYESSPNNNYGNLDTLAVNGGSGSGLRMRSYVKYNLSSIPSGSTIDGVYFWIYCTRCYPGSGSYLNMQLRSVGGSWSESSLKWNNQPGVSSTLSLTKSFNNSTGWHRWESTDYPSLITLVQRWLDGDESNNGFLLRLADESINPGDASWRSSEYSLSEYAPSLYVYYTVETDPPTPNPPTWSQAPHAHGPDSLHMVATTASDPNGVEYYFQSWTEGGHDSDGFQDSPEYVDTGLNPGTWYYYKIIVRDKSPNQNQTSDSEFGIGLTKAAKPTNPSPANDATDQSIDTDISWSNGGGASSYRVYFGPAGNMTDRGARSETSYDPPETLSYGTTYQWRIDAMDSAERITEGDVWSFTTEGQPPLKPTSPSPANEATNQSVNTDISWIGGGASCLNLVYFGTPGNMTYRGQQGETSYDPGTLLYNTTYQWQIQVYNYISGASAMGDVWSFTTQSDPATLPIISVTPASLNFDSVFVGSSALNTFTVQNIGGGTLSGSASVSSPFSIVSGGSYSLSADQAQVVTVQFSPSSEASYSQNITFTGGDGATRTVTGTGVDLQYTITPSAGYGGTISPNSPVTVNAGGNQNFTALPSSCHRISTWYLDGGIVQNGGNSYTLRNVQANHTVSVAFSQNGVVPLPPTDISASDGIHTNKVRITWNASSGATSYEVWRRDGIVAATKIVDTSNTEYDDISVADNVTYYYMIKAKNDYGVSGFSSSDTGYALNNLIIEPNIRLNNYFNQETTMRQGAPLSVGISLNANNALEADWWVVVEAPFGWYYYNAYNGEWYPTDHVTYQGPLFSFGSIFFPHEILNIDTAWLPTGIYVFYFGVDTDKNGQINMDVMHYGWTVLHITN
ncbi:MAG: DNRLRE domain-containing protein [Kiritimatiellae bacterium]|nr:DNRLRE domain-containing protein [Kiritimatiellia bacterium]